MVEHVSASPRLLVIDDDRDLCLFLQDLLTEEGYAVDICGTLDEALGLLDAHVYHLVLSDLLTHSPADPLRSAIIVRHYAHPTPVAVLTGWNISDAEVARVGLARVIAKPFDIANLVSTVSALVEERFSAEQQRLAVTIGRYCRAFNAHDVDACASLCVEDVGMYASEGAPGEPAEPVLGRVAFRAHLERYLRHNPDLRLDDYLMYTSSRGLALRCVTSWEASETPGVRVTSAASMVFRFRDDHISQINIHLEGQRWCALVPEAAYIPGAQDCQR